MGRNLFFAVLSFVVAIGMLLSSRQLLVAQSDLRVEQSRLKNSLSEQELLTSAADEAALQAQRNAALAHLREQDAKRHLERFTKEKRANEKLTDENRQLDIEQKRLASIKSAAEQRLKDLDQALIAKEQAIIEQNKKLADATWLEYTTCLAAADHAWLAKEQGQVEAWLNRCPAEWRGWEWYYLQKHATGDCPQPENYQLLADVTIEETTEFEAKPLVRKGPPLPYQISSIAAVSSDARRIGLWGRMLDVEGRPVARQTFFHVTDLDAISLSSSGSMYHIPYLARDTTWRKLMVLSDDGRFLASAGEGQGNRRFIEVADLQERKVIVDRTWKLRNGELPDLAFSENSDRFLAVSSDGWITTISLSASSGARPGAVLQLAPARIDRRTILRRSVVNLAQGRHVCHRDSRKSRGVGAG